MPASVSLQLIPSCEFVGLGQCAILFNSPVQDEHTDAGCGLVYNGLKVRYFLNFFGKLEGPQSLDFFFYNFKFKNFKVNPGLILKSLCVLSLALL